MKISLGLKADKFNCDKRIGRSTSGLKGVTPNA